MKKSRSSKSKSKSSNNSKTNLSERVVPSIEDPTPKEVIIMPTEETNLIPSGDADEGNNQNAGMLSNFFIKLKKSRVAKIAFVVIACLLLRKEYMRIFGNAVVGPATPLLLPTIPEVDSQEVVTIQQIFKTSKEMHIAEEMLWISENKQCTHQHSLNDGWAIASFVAGLTGNIIDLFEAVNTNPPKPAPPGPSPPSPASASAKSMNATEFINQEVQDGILPQSYYNDMDAADVGIQAAWIFPTIKVMIGIFSTVAGAMTCEEAKTPSTDYARITKMIRSQIIENDYEKSHEYANYFFSQMESNKDCLLDNKCDAVEPSDILRIRDLGNLAIRSSQGAARVQLTELSSLVALQNTGWMMVGLHRMEPGSSRCTQFAKYILADLEFIDKWQTDSKTEFQNFLDQSTIIQAECTQHIYGRCYTAPWSYNRYPVRGRCFSRGLHPEFKVEVTRDECYGGQSWQQCDMWHGERLAREHCLEGLTGKMNQLMNQWWDGNEQKKIAGIKRYHTMLKNIKERWTQETLEAICTGTAGTWFPTISPTTTRSPTTSAPPSSETN